MRYLATLGAVLLLSATSGLALEDPIRIESGVVAPGQEVRKLAGGFLFTEGPAADAVGNLVFTDIRAAKIHRWTVAGELELVRENSGAANGLAFDGDGNLVACEGGNRRVTSMTPDGDITVLADRWRGKRFSRPNDLWIRERKVAGILVEARGLSADRPGFVAGFGVNVNQRAADFPPGLVDSVTSLALSTGRRHDRTAVLRALLTCLEPRLDEALTGRVGAELQAAYRQRSVLVGRRVTLLDGDEPVEGVVVDLSATEGLLVRSSAGHVRHVRAEHARDVHPG